MRIEDRFTVALPLAQAWDVLRDVERIAPCMPGAQLTEVEGDEYRGVVKVKLGAITAQYKGAVRFSEVDEATHRMVLSAKGRETRGQGNASADVVVTLVKTSAGTEVAIDTDLTISGKIAQFGRGVLADVSSKLLGEFARCLEEDLTGSAGDEGSNLGSAGGAGSVGDLDFDDADPGMALSESTDGGAIGASVTDSGMTDSGMTDSGMTDSGMTGEPGAGEQATGYETTSSAATGIETTGEASSAGDDQNVIRGDDGPDANGRSAAQTPTAASTPATPTPAATSTVTGNEGGAGVTPPAPSPLRSVPSRPSKPLDLLALAGPGMAQRALPTALVVDLVLLALIKHRVVRWVLSAAGTGLVAAVVGSQRDK